MTEFERKVARKVLSIIYYLFTELGQFCTYKTFHDEDWGIIWDYFYVLGSFIKNLCEDNANYFKRFLNIFKPKLKSVEAYNFGEHTLMFNLFVRMESLGRAYNSSELNTPRLVMADRPELYICHMRMIDIVTEFVNGPCHYSQRNLYIYRPDIWIGYIMRDVDDVNSPFYFLKSISLEYVLGLTEGEGSYPLDEETIERYGEDPFLVSKFFVNSITPSEIFEIMYKMLKRLAIYCLILERPGLRRQIIKDVMEYWNRRYQADKKLGLKSAKDLRDGKQKVLARYKNFGVFESKLSIVTQEMMDVYAIEDYNTLLNLYMNNMKFSDHLIIKIAVKIYAFLETLSQQSRNVDLFLETKKMRLVRFYGEQVDLDDRVLISNKNKLLAREAKMPEDMIFFMFILKISKKIELKIHPPTLGYPISKSVIFPLLPETFFLQGKTKDDMLETIDPDNRRIDFQNRFELLFADMMQNYKMNQRSRILFYLSKTSTFSGLKAFCYLIGMVINALVIWHFKLGEAEQPDDRRLRASTNPKLAIDIISLSFSGFSFFLFLIWLILKSPLTYNLMKERYRYKYPVKDPSRLAGKLYIYFYMTLLKSRNPVNFLLHAIFALLAYTTTFPFYHTLHLLLLVNISKTARYVMKALTGHADQLLVTFILTIFIIYSFSTINAQFFSGAFDTQVVDTIDACSTIGKCLIYSLDMGLRNGGGIADSHILYDFEEGEGQGPWKVIFKLVFDLGFFLMVQLIALNIIFGIIVDTFSEMRGKGDERSK